MLLDKAEKLRRLSFYSDFVDHNSNWQQLTNSRTSIQAQHLDENLSLAVNHLCLFATDMIDETKKHSLFQKYPRITKNKKTKQNFAI